MNTFVMLRKFVNSTNLLSVRYQPYTNVLEVSFHNGHVYQYFKVPAAVYTAFMQAPSLGQYFNQNIRKSYQYRLVH